MDEEKAKIIGQNLDPLVRIGKKGITEGIIEEINRHLDDRDLIKIKVLRNNPIQDIDQVGEKLEEVTIGKVMEIKGKTILLLNEEEF